MIHKICKCKKKSNDFGYYYHGIDFVNKELRVNYVPEIRNECDLLEQLLAVNA